MDIDNITDNDSEDFIPPSASNVSSRNEKLFSVHNATVLKKCCKAIISVGPISGSCIQEVLEKSSEGQMLLDNFSMDSIFNQVKYERRLHRSRK